jgi:flagellar assembly factor FliW
MFIETSRFGKVAYKKSEVIWMVRSLLGFEDYKRFIVISINGQEPFKWLQSLDDPNLAFLAIDPLFFMADYIIEVNPKDITLLGARDVKNINTLVLVTIPNGQPDKMSANLQGPIIINNQNMQAAQLVLGDSNYTTKHSIFRELETKLAPVHS